MITSLHVNFRSDMRYSSRQGIHSVHYPIYTSSSLLNAFISLFFFPKFYTADKSQENTELRSVEIGPK